MLILNGLVWFVCALYLVYQMCVAFSVIHNSKESIIRKRSGHGFYFWVNRKCRLLNCQLCEINRYSAARAKVESNSDLSFYLILSFWGGQVGMAWHVIPHFEALKKFL